MQTWVLSNNGVNTLRPDFYEVRANTSFEAANKFLSLLHGTFDKSDFVVMGDKIFQLEKEDWNTARAWSVIACPATERTGTRTIYVDMDGVLAKWNTEASFEDIQKDGYFLNLLPENGIIVAVQSLLSKGYDVRALSSAWSVQAVWEKREWLNRYVSTDMQSIFVPAGKDKSDYVSEHDAVLLDDFGRNLAEWKGVPVKFYNGINGHGHTEYKNAIYACWPSELMEKKLIKLAKK